MLYDDDKFSVLTLMQFHTFRTRSKLRNDYVLVQETTKNGAIYTVKKHTQKLQKMFCVRKISAEFRTH